MKNKLQQFMFEERKRILERNVEEYPDEYVVFQGTIESLIFELDMIDETDHMYSAESIKERLRDKLKDLDLFDNILESNYK